MSYFGYFEPNNWGRKIMIVSVTLIGIEGIPDINPGDDLASYIIKASSDQHTPIQNGDILVVTQKIVSKAENRMVDLSTIEASPFAQQFAERWDKDPRLVEVVLREAKRVVRMDNGVLITETRHGFRCANSGVDASNVGPPTADKVTLLPVDSDNSARGIQKRVKDLTGLKIPVIISDTFGRPWREGASNVAIGISGLDALRDYRGQTDDYGRELQSTTIAIADELASAAELVTNKLMRIPVAIVRGYSYPEGDSGVAPLIRDPDKDMFR
jgi:coenzyme F420-0:L-glutamate ligase/coenzyme F420-1:gamma-L-glutamate ligase